VHETARRVDPTCRVVYVDVDPVAVAYATSLLAGDVGTAVVHTCHRRRPLFDRVLVR